MKTWYDRNQGLIWATSVAVSAVLWVYATFITKEALAEKEASIRTYVDEKHHGVEKSVERIENDVRDIKAVTIETLREMRRR